MTFSEIQQLLGELGVAPKKSLSQNFLIDPNIVRKIVAAADIKPNEPILEIGPGPGALTRELLKTGARVFAIEKDPVFAGALHRLQTPDNRLHVIAADALRCDLTQWGVSKAVANLPYHITTPILEALFSIQLESMTLMVQKEMADRLFALPGTKEIGSLTLFAQFYATPKGRFDVSAHCFYPKPKVDSSVITLVSKAPPLPEAAPFFQIVRTAFQQRRKTMSRSLSGLFNPEQVQNALQRIGMRPDARPEMLSLEQWLALKQTLDLIF